MNAMTPSAEFRRHAAECNRMARAAADRDSKATWKNLAARWLTCATLAEQTESAASAPKTRHHRARRRFAH